MALLIAGIFAAVYAMFRRRRLAIAITVLLGGVLFAKHWVFESLPLQVLFGGLTAAVGLFILVRYGVLGACVFGTLAYANAAIPVTFDPDAWYAGSTAAYVAAFVALLLWGWFAATVRPAASTASGPGPSATPAR
jgi:hypothetical protein